MKLIVSAHTPPPHRGQSFMVELLLRGLVSRQSGGIECLHVNARFSDDVQDIGRGSVRKVWRTLCFALSAISLRWRHGARASL